MKKLLLLLPLIFSTSVLAQSDPFGLGRNAFERFHVHVQNSYKFIEAEDYEMACSEIRKASTVIQTNFSDLQQYKPDLDWFQNRKTLRKSEKSFCSLRYRY